ncbi:ABC transporter substrate-binding protein [Bacillus hwajinpoensis]|uniref:ABC transporter substrate-binding protein n=1 Tax=Guptibacillus hwajinpoensis TaxID=208199 RepID=A0A845F0S5_9BACL|nr:nickel ABC transporter substrate-binding protein [Pseudalkalibacillus hwajinpoensis]MYL64401.1 ABC transporter substrate-binding protein [Pseudalkalibacillus hwajinpoensis]
MGSKKILVVALLCLMISIVSACSLDSNTNEKQENKSVTFLSNFPIDTLDPHLSYTPVRAGITETLVKINESFELEPWLATEWSSTGNGKKWTFMIRNNVTFQNGKKVDAEAVKRSLERSVAISESMKTALKIESIEADGQALTLTLQEPVTQLPSELVHPNTAIVDSEIDNMEQHPVGTGPFKVASFSANSKVELEGNSDYWDGDPKLDQAVLTFNEDANARTLALQSGDADIVYRPAFESLELLKQDSSIKTEVVPGIRTQLFLYHFGNVFKNENMRKAFDHMIDRNTVVSSTLSGYATIAGGPFSSELPFASNEEKEFNLDQAKEYLEAAGVEIKDDKAMKDGKQLSLKLLTYSYRPELPLMAQILQSNAKQLGIEIEIEQAENIDEAMAKQDDWDLATYSLLTAPRGDASYFMNAAFRPGGYLYEATRMNNQEVTNVADKLNDTVDPKEREKLAMEASQIINENELHSFIVHPSNVVAYKESVKNWVTSKSEFYVLTKDLDVKTE